ncbi:MAG: hypothetical protein K0Q49_430 [Haloplasmataceae bacterium]|jgi:HD-GYP domain-containing protein (c-di-GMP phosphodiesterase class II)|nr:hypothetical protein [Haloplasmataceae bacterium]
MLNFGYYEFNWVKSMSNLKVKTKKNYFLIFSYILTLLITIIVYYTGGTRYVYVMFINIPIIIATSTNGKIKGYVHAVLCGLLLGPFMPLDVDLNIKQDLINWIIRLLFFLIMSIIVSIFVDYYKKEFEKNNRIEKEISDSHLSTIYALVKLSDSRDDETGAHVERVSHLCKYLTQKLAHLPKYKAYIDGIFIDNIFKACSLHDIGKVGIPDNVLLKPGKLSIDEFEIIKKHTVIGASILKEVQTKYPNNKFLEMGYQIVHYHHEKWDGTGYPNGLVSDNIPLSARIMAIVDVYDALRSKRLYKEAYSHDVSLVLIKQGRGNHFDPDIVDVFLEHEMEFSNLFDEITNQFE